MKRIAALSVLTVFLLCAFSFGEDAESTLKKVREKDQNIGNVFKTFRLVYNKKAPWGFDGTFETLIKGNKKRMNSKSGTLTSDAIFDGTKEVLPK